MKFYRIVRKTEFFDGSCWFLWMNNRYRYFRTTVYKRDWFGRIVVLFTYVKREKSEELRYYPPPATATEQSIDLYRKGVSVGTYLKYYIVELDKFINGDVGKRIKII